MVGKEDSEWVKLGNAAIEGVGELGVLDMLEERLVSAEEVDDWEVVV